MNRKLDSEVQIFQSFEHSSIGTKVLDAQRYFSDLVPFFVTVESVCNSGCQSFNPINPMTARINFHQAVMIPLRETFSNIVEIVMLGTGLSCTPTVAFLKNRSHRQIV